MAVEQSIFKATKAVLQIADGDDSFDTEVLTFINGALSTLHDLGAGPLTGLVLTGDGEVWDDLNEQPMMTEWIKVWLYLKVRILWDPPQTSFLMDAHQKQIDEASWRIVNTKDNEHYTLIDPIASGYVRGGI